MSTESTDVIVGSRTGGDNASLDATFEALAHERRRHALAYLAEQDEWIALANLAQAIAIREHERPISAIPRELYQSIYQSLRHTHVPKLAATDTVEFDRECDLVRSTDFDGLVEDILSLDPRGDDPR